MFPDSSPPGFINASSLAASAGQPPGIGNNGVNNSAANQQGLFQSIGSGVVGAASAVSSFSTVTTPRYRKTFLRPNNYYF